VFVGGFTLDGAHAVGGDPERDVVDGVEALLRNNLVRAERIAGGEPRFGMLETIHEYARDRLEARGDGDRVRRLHARCFVPIAEAAERELLGPAQRTWLERLDADLGNLRAALAWATEAGEAETGVAIAAPLWRFWQLRRADREGREWLERLLEVPSVSSATRAVAESRLASLAFVQGDHDTVRRAGESSLPVLRRLGDDERAAGLLGVMATSSLAVGDGVRARALAVSALEVATRTGDPTFESFAVLSLGVVCAWHGELDEAERFVERSVLLASQTGNVRSVANWRRTLGGISLARGDRGRARTLFEESLVLHRTLDDDWGVARAASRLALVLLEERRESEARQLVVESIELCREAGDRPGQTFNLVICAGLAAAGGQAERGPKRSSMRIAERGPSAATW
jgi:ATP/maltotriose-dependent transcriptional regulator MalT